MAEETLKYYHADPPPLSEKTKELFERYVGIQGGEEAIINHIKTIRDKAWSLFPYPCIGGFSFLELVLLDLPVGAEVLTRMHTSNSTLLDLGCCFGQDLRDLVFSGVPSENLTGFDLRRDFIDFGYELFRDKETLKTEFVTGDFFGESGLEGEWDFVSASAFFHLFDWGEQVQAISKAVRLLKPKEGSMIFGRQTGAERAHSYPHSSSRSGEMYRHNTESFEKLVEEVAQRTGTKLEAKSELKAMEDEELRKEGFMVFNYSIRVVG